MKVFLLAKKNPELRHFNSLYKIKFIFYTIACLKIRMKKGLYGFC